MDTENNFKSEKKVKLTQFKELLEKSVVLKIAAETFEAGDFLNILLRFFGIWGSFSYINFSYKKTYAFPEFLDLLAFKTPPGGYQL